MSDLVLALPILGIPIVASVLEWMLINGITERHHSHHDTYRVSNTYTHTLLLVMVFMGVMGVVMGWLCDIGVFAANTHIVLAFFLSFLTMSFVIWTQLHCYKVVTFEDRMRVTPFFGRTRTILYKDIDHMEWHRSKSLMGYENLRVYSGGARRHVMLWGTLDLEQILMRINRYDALDNQDVY